MTVAREFSRKRFAHAAFVTVCGLGTSLLLTQTAWAEGDNLGYGRGGLFSNYDHVVSQFNASGERFRIRNRCASACTLFLGIKNVCIERSATLMFHSGNMAGPGGSGRILSASASGHMMQAYNAPLRAYLEAGGHMTRKEFHAVSGSEMISRFGYRGC